MLSALYKAWHTHVMPLPFPIRKHIPLLVQNYHYKFYLGEDGGGRRLPDAFGIRTLWETDSLTEVRHYSIQLPIQIHIPAGEADVVSEAKCCKRSMR